MSDGFGTTTEEMQRAAAHVFGVDDAVQAELATLRARLLPLAGAWRGDAATVFEALMNRWEHDARRLGVALRGIGEAIQGSAAGYRAQEEQHSTSLSTIRAALG